MTSPAPELDAGLVVPVAEVATVLGVNPDDNAAVIRDAILDAQTDVEAYLGCPVVPREFTTTEAIPALGGWQFVAEAEPVIQIVSSTPTLADGEPTGAWTVVYRAGLDAAADSDLRPIRRFVKVHAVNSPELTRLWLAQPGTNRVIRSASTDGQSVSYADPTLGGGGAAGSGLPGSLPTLATLDRWRVAGRRVYQRPGSAAPWPYGWVG